MSPSAGTSELSSCHVSERAASIKPFVVMEVLREAVQMESTANESEAPDLPRVLHLEVGQPSTPPPQPVRDVITSLRCPLGYTTALGIQSLRAAISRHYHKWYGVHVPTSCIAATTGASGALLAAFAACFDAKDRVAIAFPGYPCYRHVLIALSAEVVPIHVDAASNYQPTIEQLRQALPLAGIVVATPANPSGSVIPDADMSKLVDFCGQHSIRLIVDEIYHGVGRLPATAMAYEDVVVINSFSKYWCLTGFRIGWIATRDSSLFDAVERCLQSFSLCPPVLSQHAAEKALGDECRGELDAHVARYQRNQAVLVEKLLACGFETKFPDGAFYVWARCDDVFKKTGTKDSTELCRRLLREARVAVTPGVDFDPDRGQRFMRFSCAGSEKEVAEAAERIYELCSRRE